MGLTAIVKLVISMKTLKLSVHDAIPFVKLAFRFQPFA